MLNRLLLAGIVIVIILIGIELSTEEIEPVGIHTDTAQSKEKAPKEEAKPVESSTDAEQLIQMDRSVYGLTEAQLYDMEPVDPSVYTRPDYTVDEYDPMFMSDYKDLMLSEDVFSNGPLFENDFVRIQYEWYYEELQTDAMQVFVVRIRATSKTEDAVHLFNNDFAIDVQEDLVAKPQNAKFDYVVLDGGVGDWEMYDLYFYLPRNSSTYKMSYIEELPTDPISHRYNWQLLRR